jgi:hypothetical protein
MKYLVQIVVTPEAGHVNEKRPGGAGPIVGRLVERFKPEAFYVSPARRELIMVCPLDGQDMAELMLASAHFAGQHAIFTPVLDGKEFAAVNGKAMPAAHQLING